MDINAKMSTMPITFELFSFCNQIVLILLINVYAKIFGTKMECAYMIVEKKASNILQKLERSRAN